MHMSKFLRARNDGTVDQVVYSQGTPALVVPGGTVLLPEGSPFLGVPDMTVIGEVVVPDATPAPAAAADLESLRAQVAALQALLEGQMPAPADYPVHLGGGKWRLSNGSETKAGVSRAAAAELEAELHPEND
jgi:hypothetical protein